MKLKGITIDAVTPQNEPLNPDNNPSLVMQAADEGTFIKNFLGPAFQSSGITTKIVVYDHNCDRPDYPETILEDPAAAAFVNGSAFHLYAGDISAMSQVHNLYPDKQLYFTEQYTASTGIFAGDLQWHVQNVIIGSMRNWSRNALEWNLANDASLWTTYARRLYYLQRCDLPSVVHPLPGMWDIISLHMLRNLYRPVPFAYRVL